MRGAIVLRQKWSRGQVEARLANIPPCLIGMEACVGVMVKAAADRLDAAVRDHREKAGPVSGWERPV
jgi:transposase